MSPDRIGRGPSIASWIASVAGKSVNAGRADKRPSVISAPQIDESEHGPSLRADLAALVDGVDLDSEEAVRALRRPIFRRILLREFGAGFAEHPDLGTMIDHIESVLEADPVMPGQFLALLKELKAPPRP